jgi:hypothetical protein
MMMVAGALDLVFVEPALKEPVEPPAVPHELEGDEERDGEEDEEDETRAPQALPPPDDPADVVDTAKHYLKPAS